ncbi:MAG: hypothetical protein GX493_03770 [Firmicutes bacterium]|nr:hypothetical protein [Bacillota bacterium]
MAGEFRHVHVRLRHGRGVPPGMARRPDLPACRGEGREALLAHLDPEGNLDDVCAGTGQGNDKAYYLARPRIKGDLHGQAPLLWLAGELFAAYEHGEVVP